MDQNDYETGWNRYDRYLMNKIRLQQLDIIEKNIQPDSSKREDFVTFRRCNRPCDEPGAIWHGLEELFKSEEMRYSEHGSNIVREVQ